MTTLRKGTQVTVFHRWMRSAGAVVLGGALLAVAPAAQATDITNPADHPAPITVTVDGQDYRDGADTLPGYDDYACTPIPNVQYDFAENEIQYYDEQGGLVKTAHWTEWSRISSYETWVEQQRAASSPGSSTTTNADATPTTPTTTGTATTPSAASPAATAPAATSPTTTSAAADTTRSTTKAKRTRSKNPSSTTKAERTATKAKRSTGTSGSSRGTASATRDSAASSHAGKRRASTASSTKRGTATSRSAIAASAADASADSSDAGTAQGNGASSSAPTAGDAPKYELVSAKGVRGGVGDTRPVGVGILVAVFAAAGVAFLLGFGRRGIRTSSR